MPYPIAHFIWLVLIQALSLPPIYLTFHSNGLAPVGESSKRCFMMLSLL